MVILDILLFVLPFVLYALGRGVAPMLSRTGLALAVAAVMGIAATGLWYARQDHMGAGDRYAPAHIEGGQIVPGHAIPAK
jgi:hypothetical protein